MRFSQVSLLISTVVLFYHANCQVVPTCPKFQTLNTVRSQNNYKIQNYLRIPQTNLLIINTVLKYYDSSIVYFIDLTTQQGDVVNTITPDFLIVEMDFAPIIHRLVVINYGKIIIADSYSLKTIASVNINKGKYLKMIKNTNYAIAVLETSIIHIFDTNSAKIVTTLNANAYSDHSSFMQYFAGYYTIANGSGMILVSDDYGVFAWTADLVTSTYTYQGYISQTIRETTSDLHLEIAQLANPNIFAFSGSRSKNIMLEISSVSPTLIAKSFGTLLPLNKGKKIEQLYNFTFIYNSQFEFLLTYGTDGIVYMMILNWKKTSVSIYQIYIFSTQNTSRWYYDPESQLLLFAGYLLNGLNLLTLDFVTKFYFQFDKANPRFIYQANNIEFVFTFLIYWNFAYSPTNLSNQLSSYTQTFTIPIRYYKSTVFRVKNCYSCLVYKGELNALQAPIYIVSFKVYPVNLPVKTFEISKLGYYWTDLTFALDPFFYNNAVWVILGFPQAPNRPTTYLFLIVNMETGVTEELSVNKEGYERLNNNISSFILASLDISSNQELIGFDMAGNVYFWDLSTRNFKTYLTLETCYNAEIGTVFHYQSQKWIAVICANNFNVLLHDVNNNSTSILHTVKSIPNFIRAFQDPNMIIVGDFISGDIYIYKFYPDSLSFKFHLQISPGKVVDPIIYVELLADKTMWIQFQNSNLYFEFMPCYNDITICQACQIAAYFSPSNTNNVLQGYGQGTISNPFTTADNILVPLSNANMLLNQIVGMKEVTLNIAIDSTYEMKMVQQFVSSASNLSIRLNIKSKQDSTKLKLIYSEQVQFTNYKSIFLSSVLFSFALDSKSTSCGINLASIAEGVNLNSLEIEISMANNQINPFVPTCNSITSTDSDLTISSYTISNQTFYDDSSIITMNTSNKLEIDGLTIKNCTFFDTSKIVKGSELLTLLLMNVQISQNKCNIPTLNSVPVPLFSGSSFNATSVIIEGNSFCKKTIFQVYPSISQTDKHFEFKDISVSQNRFQQRTNYIFFVAIYQMLNSPQHKLSLTNVNFYSNTVSHDSESDVSTPSMVGTDNIKYITFNNVTLYNSHEISLSEFYNSQEVNLDRIHCENSLEFLEKNKTSFTNHCMLFQEIQTCAITNLSMKNKRILDNSLISFKNIENENGTLSITNSEITSLQLTQSGSNFMANPILIRGITGITIQVDSTNFSSISFSGLTYSLDYSATGMWIENQLGSVSIQNSNFIGSISTSKSGFLRVNAASLSIDKVKFEKSTCPDSIARSPILEGGFINLSVISLNISECMFDSAYANKGGFLRISPLESQLSVNISSSQFLNGIAVLQGGAIFFDLEDSILSFTCISCHFKNIFTMNPLVSASSLEISSRISQEGENKHKISIADVNIENTFGIGDNFFISTIFSSISISGCSKVISEPEIAQPEDASYIKYYLSQYPAETNLQQQASLLYATSNSSINITSCSISDYTLFQENSTMPNLINLVDSSIELSEVQFSNSTFSLSAIQINSGKLILNRCTFQNITQIQKTHSSSSELRRGLSSEKSFTEIFPNIDLAASTNSLIIMDNSELDIFNKTSFSVINCSASTCFGSSLQLLSSNFSITDSVFQQSTSLFGGAIFIQGINSNSQITTSKFIQNTSPNGGGALYIHTREDDKFKLDMSNLEFSKNSALSGQGGAIYARSTSEFNPEQIIELSTTSISENTAVIGGGISFSNINFKISPTVEFNNNNGIISGNTYSTTPSFLSLDNLDNFLASNNGIQDENNLIILNDFKSGSKLSKFQFSMRSAKSNLITIPLNDSEQSSYRISVAFTSSSDPSSKQFTLRGESHSAYSVESGYYEFSNIVLVGNPGEQAKLSFSSNQIYVLDEETNQQTQDYVFEIVINFRKCISGERYNTYGEYTECSDCEAGTYSMDIKKCYDCPTGATCSGGDSIIPKPTYWQKNPRSEIILSCESLEENCKGGASGDESCYEGHIGALCEECDIFGVQWGTSYSRSSKYSCVRCDEIQSNSWKVILIAIWTLASMQFAIKGTIDTIENKTAGQIIKRNLTRKQYEQNLDTLPNSPSNPSKLFSEKKAKQTQATLSPNQNQSFILKDGSRSAIYIKMLTNYLQIIGCIASFNLSIPTGVLEFPDTIRHPLQSSMRSLDCELKNIDTTLPIIYVRLLFSLAIPIIYFVIFLIGISVFFYFIHKSKNAFPRYMISTVIIFLFLYIQTDIVTQSISLLSCREIGDTSYIMSNVSFECYNDDYKTYSLSIALPLFLLFTICIPLFLFYKLKQKKEELDLTSIKLKYGFLYKEYKLDSYYWEFIKMVQKLLIILSLNFYSQDIVLKGILVFVVITGYGILTLKVSPFLEKEINSIDALSTNICAISVLLGVLIHKNEFNSIIIISFSIITIINIAFFLYLIKKIVGEFILKFDSTIQKITNYLVKLIPRLSTLHEKSREKKKVRQELKKKINNILLEFLKMDTELKKELMIEIISQSIFINNPNFYKEDIVQEVQPTETPEIDNDQITNGNEPVIELIRLPDYDNSKSVELQKVQFTQQ